MNTVLVWVRVRPKHYQPRGGQHYLLQKSKKDNTTNIPPLIIKYLNAANITLNQLVGKEILVRKFAKHSKLQKVKKNSSL